MTRRRWIADATDRETATLTGEQAIHLARVLRARPGMEFDVVADGHLHRATVISAREEEVRFTLHEELDAAADLPVTLLIAIFKFDRMEWAIEKATELGVQAIVPVIARRTEKHLAQASVKRAERWRRIAHEAAQQSRRTAAPEIADPVMLPAALAADGVPAILRLLLSEAEQDRGLLGALQSNETAGMLHRQVELSIGPEGGWTAEEMQLFASRGWQSVTLGPRILRAETAAIAALAITAGFLQ